MAEPTAPTGSHRRAHHHGQCPHLGAAQVFIATRAQTREEGRTSDGEDFRRLAMTAHSPYAIVQVHPHTEKPRAVFQLYGTEKATFDAGGGRDPLQQLGQSLQKPDHSLGLNPPLPTRLHRLNPSASGASLASRREDGQAGAPPWCRASGSGLADGGGAPAGAARPRRSILPPAAAGSPALGGEAISPPAGPARYGAAPSH